MIILRFTLLIFRAIIAFAWTMLMHVVFIRFLQLFSKKKILTGTLSFWGRGLAFIMGVKIHQINKNHRKELGSLIIANHLGFLDIPVMLTFFPGVFIIKMEMRRVFYFGKALEQQGHLFVDRGDANSERSIAIKLMRLLKSDERVIVFPEGGASPRAERKPFKVGSFAVAKRLGKTIQPCVIDYIPDRRKLEWDVKKGTLSQIASLFGRFRTDISIEFFEPELIPDDVDASQYAEKWHDIIESRLYKNDKDRDATDYDKKDNAQKLSEAK